VNDVINILILFLCYMKQMDYILTSSVINYWTDAGQQGIYLSNTFVVIPLKESKL